MTQAELIKIALKEALQEVGGVDKGRVENLEKIVINLNALVTGNGNPESGLIVKQDRTAQTLKDMQDANKKRSDREWGIWAALILSIGTSILQLAIK